MGYQVIYDDEQKKRISLRFRLIPLTGVAWLSFLLLVNAFWPRGQEVLQEFFLPEFLNEAIIAVNGFADHLKSGDGLADAFEAFYYIFEHSPY